MTSQLHKLIYLLFALAISPLAQAQTYDFMGLQLGDKFELPECATKNLTRTYATYISEPDQQIKPCWKHSYSAGKPLPSDASFEIEFLPAAGKSPRGITRSKALVVNGVVEGVIAPTDGYPSQDGLLMALVQKFGKPTTITSDEVQNRMGATFVEKNATWKLPGLNVTFSGMGSKIDFGLIMVTTPAGEADQLQKLKIREASKASF